MTRMVITESKGPYSLITISRADKRNAMNQECRQALQEALASLQGRSKVIVITGTGDSFCSGMDIKEYGASPDLARLRKEAHRDWIQTLLAIRQHPAIIIAAVNGLALGGGVSLVNVCDLAIAANSAQFGMPEIGFGTYPAMAGPSTQRMLIGKRAAWMVLTADRISADTAERWGLVNQCVPLTDLETSWDALARRIAQFDAVSLSESKKALDAIPYRISEWHSIMQYAQEVNMAIRERSDVQSIGLSRFAAGDRNPGQGN